MAGTRLNIAIACLIPFAALSVGCNGAEKDIAAGLQGELASERSAACIRAGQLRDESVLPLLVERLADSDADVRMFAIIALGKITGKTLGYHYHGLPDERSAAVQRWREWLRRQRRNDGG